MTQELLSIIVQGISFIAAFAAITAAFIMYEVTKKFGTGIIAHGFKNIAAGVLFLALGIIIDSVNTYLQLESSGGVYSAAIFIIKGACFVIGTYIIVIGSKNTADKLENVTKPTEEAFHEDKAPEEQKLNQPRPEEASPLVTA